jgi:hypothetical protein
MVIQLDDRATTAPLNGMAVKGVASNPRTVQAATLVATEANAGWRAMTAPQISPGTTTN